MTEADTTRHTNLVGENRSLRFRNAALLADRERSRLEVLAAIAKLREDLAFTAPELWGMRVNEMESRLKATVGEGDPIATYAFKRGEADVWESFGNEVVDMLRSQRTQITKMLADFDDIDIHMREVERAAAAHVQGDQMAEVENEEAGPAGN